MQITSPQLKTFFEQTWPEHQLTSLNELSTTHWRAVLTTGERLSLLCFATPTAAATAAAALTALRSELDLPVPQLAGAVPTDLADMPCLLVSELSGEPLASLAGKLNEQQLYALGRRLGEIAYRIHRVARPAFGGLTTEQPSFADETALVQAEINNACAAIPQLPADLTDELQAWAASDFTPIATQAALVHGNLSPTTVLVRLASSGPRISMLSGWEAARAWVPGWEHSRLLDAFAGQAWFSLRVGYGNAYDEATVRTYEQVRDLAYAPYRLIATLHSLRDATSHGQSKRASQFLRLVRLLLTQLNETTGRLLDE
jgi:hypothetical protein